MNIDGPRDYFAGLQSRIVGALEAIEGRPFRRDAWERPEGGGGVARVIEDGSVLERGGVNLSHVPGIAGRTWEAVGCRWFCIRAIRTRRRCT